LHPYSGSPFPSVLQQMLSAGWLSRRPETRFCVNRIATIRDCHNPLCSSGGLLNCFLRRCWLHFRYRCEVVRQIRANLHGSELGGPPLIVVEIKKKSPFRTK
jgi:hypothetical protein